MAAVEDTLEVGCLHVGLIAVRNIKSAKQGGISDFFGLTPQHKPYCKLTLGVSSDDFSLLDFHDLGVPNLQRHQFDMTETGGLFWKMKHFVKKEPSSRQ